MKSKKVAFTPKIRKQVIDVCDQISESGNGWAREMATGMKDGVAKYKSLTLRQVHLLCDTAIRLDIPLSPELKTLDKQAVLESRTMKEQMDELLKEMKKIRK